jgi:hypothetical protein
MNLPIPGEYLKIASILHSMSLKGVWSNDAYPMVSLPFLDWFNSYKFSDWDMIEFGAGDSTIYFSSKTKNYTSIESDIIYYDIVMSKVKNVSMQLVTLEDIENGNYDIAIGEKTIVFIDSNGNRLKTTKSLISKGKPNIIFFDNSEWYPNSCEFLYESGYTEIPFWGIRFEEHQDKCTSVFIKDGFKLPKRNYKYLNPGSTLGGWEHNDR